MSTSDSTDGGYQPIAPSVSREKWIQHALNKLAKGYFLIVNVPRKNANFYKPGKGYEMCAFKTARQLITDGLLEPVGRHPLGDRYVAAAHAYAPPAPAVDEDDEPMTLVDDSIDLSVSISIFESDSEGLPGAA